MKKRENEDAELKKIKKERKRLGQKMGRREEGRGRKWEENKQTKYKPD